MRKTRIFTPMTAILCALPLAPGKTVPRGQQAALPCSLLPPGQSLSPDQPDGQFAPIIVNREGFVYGKDLGTNTAALARQMIRFNPDRTWRPIELE